jgi:hypothetical protein
MMTLQSINLITKGLRSNAVRGNLLRQFSAKIEKESIKKSNPEKIKQISKKTNQDFLNLIYFHKRRFIIGSVFCGCYGYLCLNTKHHPWEAVRLGIAGSVANCVCECAFHLVDTLNIRSKVSSTD